MGPNWGSAVSAKRSMSVHSHASRFSASSHLTERNDTCRFGAGAAAEHRCASFAVRKSSRCFPFAPDAGGAVVRLSRTPALRGPR